MKNNRLSNGMPTSSGPVRNSWARDPFQRDRARMAAALTVINAIGCRKRAAQRLGKSVDVLDQYCGGSESSPVYRHDQLILASEHPEHLVTHARIVALRAMLEGRTLQELHAELREILLRAEPLAEHRQNLASLAFLSGESRAELRATLEHESALQLRACAIIDRIEELERQQS